MNPSRLVQKARDTVNAKNFLNLCDVSHGALDGIASLFLILGGRDLIWILYARY